MDCRYAAQIVLFSLRHKNWKFVEPSDGKPVIPWGANVETGYLPIPQLYDLRKGREEQNLSVEYPEKVYEMETLLRKVRKGVAQVNE